MPLLFFCSSATARTLRSLSLLGALTLPFAFSPQTVQAQIGQPTGPVGQIISYQGQLTDTAGKPVANGATSLTFKIYEEGTEVASQTMSVATVGGVFNTFLSVGNLVFDPAKSYELGITFNGAEVKHPLAAVPVAVQAATATKANNADNAITAENVTGIVAIANGGTGSATQPFVDLTTEQTVGGVKTFTEALKTNSSLLATGTLNGGGGSAQAIPIEGSGTRMMWYPGKAAFRAGAVDGTQWDDANIGSGSVALGQDTRASGDNGFATGLRSVAANIRSVAMGEDCIASGAASVALGFGAHTNARQGSFVFADRSVAVQNGTLTPDYFRAAVNHSASWRVSGGFRVFTSPDLSTGVTFQSGATTSNWGQSGAAISSSTGAYLSTGGTWVNASSRDLKTNFAAVNPREVLQKVLRLPISTWNYKTEKADIRHIGAMSQDFRKSFRLGDGDRNIATVDADGVAFAAIQGLNSELQDTKSQLRARDAKIASLEARLEKLEAKK